MNDEIYRLAEGFDREAATYPGTMMAETCKLQLTRPFKEWNTGYDPSLELQLEIKQFAGTMAVSPKELQAGKPFVFRIRLCNTGVCPWISGVGHRLEVGGDAQRLGLPTQWEYSGPPMVFGDIP